MVKVRKTKKLPFPLKYYTRVGQGVDECLSDCGRAFNVNGVVSAQDLARIANCVDVCAKVRRRGSSFVVKA